jgi:hypothetical protein
MVPRRLTVYDLPDLGPYVVHFTGRRPTARELQDNPSLRDRWPIAESRLSSIIREGRIAGGRPYWGPLEVTCFTESVPATVSQLVRDGRYSPHGIAFRKDVVFARGGAPVWYVRGDEWDDLVRATTPEQHARMVRLWPGDEPDGAGVSEWLHEREWRVIGDFRFADSEIAFLITPEVGWSEVPSPWASVLEEYEHEVEGLPEVTLDASGEVIHDPDGFFGG